MFSHRVVIVRHKLTLISLIISSLTGCTVRSPVLSDELLRPVIVMKYALPMQTATNNVPALRDAINLSSVGAYSPHERQVVIVSNIGKSGSDIAMERAKSGAMLALSAGEIDPRLYVRNNFSNWQSDTLEIYIVPKKLWGDQAYKAIVTSESVSVTALGGVLKAEVARLGLDQVMERRLDVSAGSLLDELRRSLSSVGWSLESYKVPPVSKVNAFTLGVVLGNSGEASQDEAMEISRSIVQMSTHPNLTIKSDLRRKVIEIYGV